MPGKKKNSKLYPSKLKVNIFFLSLFSFCFISVSTFSIYNGVNSSKSANIASTKMEVIASEKAHSVVKPLLINNSVFPLLTAQSVLAVDLASEEILFEKDPNQPSLPASTTKIMTALVALDYFPLDKIVKVNGLRVEGQKMGLIEGEELTVDDLLHGLLVYSANDAAETLAENFPGGREFFVTSMNLKAKRLGLNDTIFTNPSGLDDIDQQTSAADLIKISVVAMENPIFSKIVSTKEKIVISTDGRIEHKLVNINKLLGSVEGVLGVKTGWTENARENLVTYVKRDDKELMIALLGSQDRFGETENLINWILTSYEWREFDESNQMMSTVSNEIL